VRTSFRKSPIFLSLFKEEGQLIVSSPRGKELGGQSLYLAKGKGITFSEEKSAAQTGERKKLKKELVLRKEVPSGVIQGKGKEHWSGKDLNTPTEGRGVEMNQVSTSEKWL